MKYFIEKIENQVSNMILSANNNLEIFKIVLLFVWEYIKIEDEM